METAKEYCPECGKGEWVGLTDEERQQIVDLSWRQAPSIEAYVIRSMQYAEAKLKEKNANPIN